MIPDETIKQFYRNAYYSARLSDGAIQYRLEKLTAILADEFYVDYETEGAVEGLPVRSEGEDSISFFTIPWDHFINMHPEEFAQEYGDK